MWRKPNRCTTGVCPEVDIRDDLVRVRSTIHPDVVVTFTPSEWDDLVAAIKAGEYDQRESTSR